MTVTAPDRSAAPAILTEAVQRLKWLGPFAFGRVFLPHLLSGAESALHAELNAWHAREARQDPGARDAFAAPRGHGKTTAGVEVPAIWHAAYCIRRFTVIASSTWSQARDRITTIAHEVETSEELRAAFPNLRPARDEQGNLVAWRDDVLAFACGCWVVGVGAGKSVRGAKQGELRPDLLLLDDLEDEDSVNTAEAIAKRLRWIMRVALPLAGPMRGLSALWVGTILSRAALLNLVTGAALDEGQDRPLWARSWTPHIFSAEVKGSAQVETRVRDLDTGRWVEKDDGSILTYLVGEPLWSELTREDLAAIRYSIDALSYAAEYLNDPAEGGTSILAPARSASYVNPSAPPLQRIVRLPSGQLVPVSMMTRAAALDPQYSDPGARSDPDLAAIAVVGVHGVHEFWLDGWTGRDRHGQAARLVDMATRWGCYAAAVEATAAQTTTADEAARLARIPIKPEKPTEGKEERAGPLAIRLGDRERPESCRVFCLPDAEHLRPYLEAFPGGRYKDPVDAVVMAGNLAWRVAPREAASAPQTGGTRAT